MLGTQHVLTVSSAPSFHYHLHNRKAQKPSIDPHHQKNSELLPLQVHPPYAPQVCGRHPDPDPVPQGSTTQWESMEFLMHVRPGQQAEGAAPSRTWPSPPREQRLIPPLPSLGPLPTTALHLWPVSSSRKPSPLPSPWCAPPSGTCIMCRCCLGISMPGMERTWRGGQQSSYYFPALAPSTQPGIQIIR